eukprot:1144349-Pelagomonas_calceolata.AAC.11
MMLRFKCVHLNQSIETKVCTPFECLSGALPISDGPKVNTFHSNLSEYSAPRKLTAHRRSIPQVQSRENVQHSELLDRMHQECCLWCAQCLMPEVVTGI